MFCFLNDPRCVDTSKDKERKGEILSNKTDQTCNMCFGSTLYFKKRLCCVSLVCSRLKRDRKDRSITVHLDQSTNSEKQLDRWEPMRANATPPNTLFRCTKLVGVCKCWCALRVHFVVLPQLGLPCFLEPAISFPYLSTHQHWPMLP